MRTQSLCIPFFAHRSAFIWTFRFLANLFTAWFAFLLRVLFRGPRLVFFSLLRFLRMPYVLRLLCIFLPKCLHQNVTESPASNPVGTLAVVHELEGFLLCELSIYFMLKPRDHLLQIYLLLHCFVSLDVLQFVFRQHFHPRLFDVLIIVVKMVLYHL